MEGKAAMPGVSKVLESIPVSIALALICSSLASEVSFSYISYPKSHLGPFIAECEADT